MNRFLAPTPPFWAKVRNIAGTVATIAGVAVVAAPMAGVTLPAGVVALLTHIAAAGGTLTIASQGGKFNEQTPQ